MKASTKTARKEIKKLIDTVGIENILGEHLVEIAERTGCLYSELHNAMRYYKYRKC